MTPQELKNSILHLAIQGKLVEQRPDEGTGEELYQQIKNHQRDIKVGKDELNYDSMDFDIPDSWATVELNQLFYFVDYRGKTPSKTSQGVFLITASNIKKGTMDYTRKEYISQEEYKDRQSRGITRKGDLLFTTEAPMGNAAICDLDECSCGQRIITFQEYKEGTALPTLFMYFILSPQFQKQLLDNCTGTTAKGIKADKLKHFRLPLPPYAEQKRIVARIEELLPYIDRYEKAWSKLEELNKRFPTDMQKSILQTAFQGRLVEQRPEEGTGEELYQQIHAEKQRLIKEGKLKKEKPLPEITEDEIPFDVPESWKWVRVANITTLNPKNDLDDNIDVAFIPMNCVFDGFRNQHTFEIKKWKEIKKGFTHFANGDIGIAKITPCFQNRKSVVFMHLKNGFGAGTTELSIVRAINDTVLHEYLLWFFKTDYFISNGVKSFTGTAGQQRIHKDYLATCLIPLPPLAEQKRIVAKLEEILPLCEKLK